MKNDRTAFDHPLFPLITLGLLVYGVIALEIWLLTIGLWVGIVWLMATIICVALAIAIGMARVLDEKAGPERSAPAPAPVREAVPAPAPAPAPVRRPRPAARVRPGRPVGAR